MPLSTESAGQVGRLQSLGQDKNWPGLLNSIQPTPVLSWLSSTMAWASMHRVCAKVTLFSSAQVTWLKLVSQPSTRLFFLPVSSLSLDTGKTQEKSDDSVRKCFPSPFGFKTDAHNPRTFTGFSFPGSRYGSGKHLSWLGPKLGTKVR